MSNTHLDGKTADGATKEDALEPRESIFATEPKDGADIADISWMDCNKARLQKFIVGHASAQDYLSGWLERRFVARYHQVNQMDKQAACCSKKVKAKTWDDVRRIIAVRSKMDVHMWLTHEEGLHLDQFSVKKKRVESSCIALKWDDTQVIRKRQRGQCGRDEDADQEE